MDESSLLETTAEIAVAFAGFISIFLALATRDGRFPPGDSLSIRAIVLGGVTPVFFCAVPLVLHSLGASAATLWRISSGIVVLAGVAISAYLALRQYETPSAERTPGVEQLIGWSLSNLALLCSLSNLLAWPWGPSGGLYLLAVWLVVATAGFYFVALIFRKIL